MFVPLLSLFLFSVGVVTSDNLSGIFILDSCECSPTSDAPCQLKGPFIFEHQRTSLAVRYGSVQVGVGTVDQDYKLDMYLNENRCKGYWNPKSRLVEFKCQQKNAVCATKLRCASGACLQTRAAPEILVSSAKRTVSVVSLFYFTIFYYLFI